MCESKCSCDIQNESVLIKETDSMGREAFWLDAGRPEDK